jgi:hypothetical protein
MGTSGVGANRRSGQLANCFQIDVASSRARGDTKRSNSRCGNTQLMTKLLQDAILKITALPARSGLVQHPDDDYCISGDNAERIDVRTLQLAERT